LAQKRLDVAQVSSALVEQERGGRMPQGMSGNNGHPRALAGELEACVEGLLLKGAQSRPGKTSADPAKLTPPPRRSRTPLTLSRKANHPPSESDNSRVERQIAKRAAFDLEAGGNNHPL
jgi:hypothetical protein